MSRNVVLRLRLLRVDGIWKLKCQLRHIKRGLILKLSLRPFLLYHLESLRIFFHFMSPCCAVPILAASHDVVAWLIFVLHLGLQAFEDEIVRHMDRQVTGLCCVFGASPAHPKEVYTIELPDPTTWAPAPSEKANRRAMLTLFRCGSLKSCISPRQNPVKRSIKILNFRWGLPHCVRNDCRKCRWRRH